MWNMYRPHHLIAAKARQRFRWRAFWKPKCFQKVRQRFRWRAFGWEIFEKARQRFRWRTFVSQNLPNSASTFSWTRFLEAKSRGPSDLFLRSWGIENRSPKIESRSPNSKIDRDCENHAKCWKQWKYLNFHKKIYDVTKCLRFICIFIHMYMYICTYVHICIHMCIYVNM